MNVLILGGSGFIGRAICNKLVAAGHLVTVPTRKRDNAREIFMLPTVTVIEADVHDVDALASLAHGHDVVINLVGILNEKKRGDFERSHVTLTANALAACKVANVPRYLHVSALGAAIDAPSQYLQSKAKAEALVRQSGLDATIFAPSIVFGRGDSFLNRFAKLVRLTPPLMPFVLPGSGAKFQPIYVEDVASAFVNSITNKSTYGQRYELAGPKVYTLSELVRYTMVLQNDRHVIIGLPGFVTSLLAGVMQFVPTQPLTPDNVKSMSVDNVSDAAFPSFAGLRATPLEQIAPTYIGHQAVTDEFAEARKRAGDRM
ncbi:MAG: complex I NDUFA9 subunit family protein [Casimicrobium sp.]